VRERLGVRFAGSDPALAEVLEIETPFYVKNEWNRDGTQVMLLNKGKRSAVLNAPKSHLGHGLYH